MSGFPVIVLAAAMVIAFLYKSPFGRCGKCRGRGNIPRGRKAPKCPRCGGSGRQQRPGSRTVHRAVRMIRAERARARKFREAAK